jgi:hypothetical protein
MEGENPKEHDFDQRHDGPFDPPRPSVQFHRNSDPSRPSADREPIAPAPGRKSVQIARGTRDDFSAPPRAATQAFTSPPRTSTQMSRGRPSRDFDQRRDGPFGRPSITMDRRRSSGKVLPTGTEFQRRPTLPSTDLDVEKEKAEEQRQQDQLGEATGPSEPAEPAETVAPTLEELSSDVAFEPEPPPLNYSLWPRKWSIIFFWGLILIDCIAMPIGLYFGLWYGTSLSPNAVFSIVTAALGGISIFEYFLRFRRLFKKGSTCRVIGARRAYLDWFHWNFSLGWVIIMIELIV